MQSGCEPVEVSCSVCRAKSGFQAISSIRQQTQAHTEKWRYLSYPSALAPTSIPANLSESSETFEHSEAQVLGLAWCHTVGNCRYVGVISSHITGIQQTSLLAPDLLEPPVPLLRKLETSYTHTQRHTHTPVGGRVCTALQQTLAVVAVVFVVARLGSWPMPGTGPDQRYGPGRRRDCA